MTKVMLEEIMVTLQQEMAMYEDGYDYQEEQEEELDFNN